MKENNRGLVYFNDDKSLTCVGTGLITLDIILEDANSSSPLAYAGGSCCNVLTILAFLGWNSIPIGKLSNDNFGKKIIQDLKKWGVDVSKIFLEESGNTPIIIEKLGKRKNGSNGHIFSLTCPKCGSFLPRFKPIPLRQIFSNASEVFQSNVFYFDRVSRSSIELAKLYKKQGAFVFFEPPKIKDEKIYHECYDIADVVKFSDEKSNESTSEFLENLNSPLLIETLGVKGLKYRFNNKKWKNLPAFPVNNFVDAAGAGDWCSAGFIHDLHKNGHFESNTYNEKAIKNALIFGQCLSAINCHFTGARGGMYHLSKKEFDTAINILMNGESKVLNFEKSMELKRKSGIKFYCPKCKK